MTETKNVMVDFMKDTLKLQTEIEQDMDILTKKIARVQHRNQSLLDSFAKLKVVDTKKQEPEPDEDENDDIMDEFSEVLSGVLVKLLG